MSGYPATPQGGGPTRLVAVKNGGGPVTEPPHPARTDPTDTSSAKPGTGDTGKGEADKNTELQLTSPIQPKRWMRVSEVRTMPEREQWHYLPNTVGLFMGRQGRNRVLKKKPDPALAIRQRAGGRQLQFWNDSLAAAYVDFNVWLQQQWIELVDGDVLLYRNLLIQELWQETQRIVATITVSQSKGGVGKSPTTVYISTSLAERSRRSVTCIDNNEDRGTTARELGIDPSKTMTVRQLRDLHQEGVIDTVRDFNEQLGASHHGVAVLASDAPQLRTSLYTYDQSYECVALGQDYSVFVVNDTGNHTQGDAMQAALQLTDVLVVPTIPGSWKSTDGFTGAMRDYANWGHPGLAKHSIAVVTGLPRGQFADDFRKDLELSNGHTLMGVPWDARIDRGDPADLAKTALFTEIAYLEITLAAIKIRRHTMSVVEKLPRIDMQNDSPEDIVEKKKVLNDTYEENQKRLIDLPRLDLRQGHLVPLPDGRTPVLPYCAL